MEQTVFVVDDDAEIRETIKLLLTSVDLAVETYMSAEEFLQSYNQQPGCLVLDIRMKGTSGLQLQKTLAECNNTIPIIFITGYGDISMTKRAFKDGAADFFTKPFNNQELLDTIQQVLQQNLLKQEKQAKKNEIQTRAANLTSREQEIITGIVSGKSNKILADELNLSVSTIETHRANIMRKMQAETFADLIKMVIIISDDFSQT